MSRTKKSTSTNLSNAYLSIDVIYTKLAIMGIMKVVFVIKDDSFKVLAGVILPNALNLFIIVLLEFLLGFFGESIVQQKLWTVIDACFFFGSLCFELGWKDYFWCCLLEL